MRKGDKEWIQGFRVLELPWRSPQRMRAKLEKGAEHQQQEHQQKQQPPRDAWSAALTRDR